MYLSRVRHIDSTKSTNCYQYTYLGQYADMKIVFITIMYPVQNIKWFRT